MVKDHRLAPGKKVRISGFDYVLKEQVSFGPTGEDRIWVAETTIMKRSLRMMGGHVPLGLKKAHVVENRFNEEQIIAALKRTWPPLVKIRDLPVASGSDFFAHVRAARKGSLFAA